MARIVGIDLGTTYSCVAIFNERKGIFEVLPSKSGQQTTPSVVGLNPKGEVIVGDAAKRQLATKPDATVAEIKRHMGELGADGKPYVTRFAGRDHTPEELSAYILRDLKEAAERALGEKVAGAVITVPAYFEEPQRQATMRAGKMAGLDVKRIINEPTAAAIAYGHDQSEEDEDEDAPTKPIRLLIYDLGGGTFDVSIIEVERGNIRVKATHGNHYLGGVDFDRAITSWAAQQIKAKFGVDIEAIAAGSGKDAERARLALGRIRVDAENYKKELSSQDAVTMAFPMLPVPDPRTGEPIDVELEITRADFEAMISGKIKETIASVEAALTDAKMKPTDIDEVILVGGSTRIPMVKRALSRHFSKEPRTDIHPDLCVALGAAHEAVKHIDVSEVAPDVRAAVEDKVAAMPTVVDVTGHSLGVAVEGTYMSVLIPRQTPIPAMVTKSYVTAADNQTVVNVQVYQGENRVVSNNTSLREFLLENLPKRPAGAVTIDITFGLDSNDTLTVTARDTITGQQREVEIKDERLRGTMPSGLLPTAEPPRIGTPVSAGPAPSGSMGEAPPIPEKYKRFVQQANELMPRLGPDQAARLRAAVELLYSAVRANNPAVIEAAGNGLMDTLFDVRP
jgi:molecular chaperone DnaK